MLRPERSNRSDRDACRLEFQFQLQERLARRLEVPNVLLMEFPMAESTIRKAGLKIDQIVRVPHEKVAGIVVGQGPGPGTRVMVGYQMRLYVSKGPK